MSLAWLRRCAWSAAGIGLAAACGSDGDSTEAAGATTSAAGAASAAAAGPADSRGWGVKDKTLTGPAGLSVDLAACPARWSDTAGLTPSEIRLGHSFVLSGALAPFAAIDAGMKNYFEYVNAVEGGIGGRKLTLLTKDDGYEAARVKANTDELLETGNLFALTTTAGTPGNLAVYDKVNEECVPSLMVGSGHPAWGDPRDHPWIMSSFLSYSTEANIWGKYILDTLGKGASVAALVMNNDFGLSMRSNFETFAKANGLTFRAEVHDPAAPNVTNELTTLASSNADVAILMTTSSYCTQAFTAIAQSTWKPKVKLVSQTCAGIATFFKPAGETGRDWVLAGGNKELTDKAFANDPFVQTARATMEKAGLDPANAQHGNGWWYAWGTAEVLRNAAKLPGGLTRTNTLLAMRSLDTHHPLMYDGIKFAQNGLKDSFTVEGAQLTRYTIEPGQEVGAHVPFGPPIDVNATTRNCSWDGKACREY